jgi:hypothetical protein
MLRRIILSLTLIAATLLPAGTVSAQSRSTPPAVKMTTESVTRMAFDRSKFTRDRSSIDRGPSFPFLNGDYEVLQAGGNKIYNCIAHSLGIHNRWVNPETGPASNPLSRMDQMYRAKGYSRVKGLNFNVEPGKEKVVVYATVNDGRIKEVTHAAVQEKTGTWTSKLGQLALIRHRTPEALNGPTYGQPVAIYVRPAR